MTIQNKVLLTLSLFTILILIGSGIYLGVRLSRLQQRSNELTETIRIQHERLTESLQRANSESAETERELLRIAATNSFEVDLIKEDLRAIGAKISAIAVTTAGTKTVYIKQAPSDISSPASIEIPTCPEDGRPIDIYGYTKRNETIHLDDSLGMRVGSATFAAGERAPWTTKVYPLKYRILNVLGKTPNGTPTLHTELMIENEDIHPGATFRVPGISSELRFIREEIQFRWWDPRLHLGVGSGVGLHPEVLFSAQAFLGFSFLSYGSLRVLPIGLGYDFIQESALFTVAPVSYNIGDPLPFFSDLWLALYFGIDHQRQMSIGISLSTTI